jgi:GNAT superfamily N-acetyltransferase
VTFAQAHSDLEVAPLSVADLPAALALSQAVKWPHRLEDWRFVFEIGAGLAAFSGGRLIGVAMWWPYGDRQSRIGMVIVDPSLQRAGVGRRLMARILNRAASPTILLNATKEGEALYRRLGFQPIGEIFQHQGVAAAEPALAARDGQRLRPFERRDADVVLALDAAAVGAERRRLIDRLLIEGEAILLEEGGAVAGFAFHRRFGRGGLIGPVAARDAGSAQALIAHWIGVEPGLFQRIDLSSDLGLSPWLEARGLKQVDSVTTMVLGAPPQTGAVKIFGIANQALG